MSSIVSFKTMMIMGVIGACVYYGWPIIEAIILVLPIPDPKDQIDRVKSAAGSAADFVSSQMSSGPPARSSGG
jgi:hypothetical protein